MSIARSRSIPGLAASASSPASAASKLTALRSIGSCAPATTVSATDGVSARAALATARSFSCVMSTRARQLLITKASFSALVDGLIGLNTAPAFSAAKIAITASRQLSMNTITRSPRAMPPWASAPARRSDARPSSRYVTRAPPATSATLSPNRRALSLRNCSTRISCLASGRRDCVLALHERYDGADRIEILRHDLGVRHVQAELAFQERHQFEHAGRIDQAGVEQRLAIADRQAVFAEQKIVFDELAHLALGLCAHDPSLGDCVFDCGSGSGRKLALPELGRQHADERGVVAEADEFPVTALGDEALDRGGIEIAGGGDLGRGETARHVIRGIRADERPRVGRAVGLLGAVRDRRWQQPLGGLAEDVLLAQAVELELRWNARAQLDHAVIEEREAALDRVRHGDAIALRGEDVARQQVRGFEILRLRERVPTGKFGGEAFTQFGERVVAGERRAQLAREQRLGARGAA